MRRIIYCMGAVTVVCGLLLAWNVAAQSRGAASADEPKTTTQPTKYTLIPRADRMQRDYAQLDKQFVEMPDYFGKEVTVTALPRAIRRRYRVLTTDRYAAFTTHGAYGSNMLCFVDRKDEKAIELLKALSSEERIYLMGQVGPRTEFGGAWVTLFIVDKICRGDEPPKPPPKKKEKEPVVLILEWNAVTPAGVQRRKKEYKIPKPNKRYEITDPYSGKPLYITLKY